MLAFCMLFDAGQEFSFISNAARMDLDANKIPSIVLSHGHHNHTGGLSEVLNSIDDYEHGTKHPAITTIWKRRQGLEPGPANELHPFYTPNGRFHIRSSAADRYVIS
jgi:metal-dependent hydrolase (beta-lactamase superfamily II)